MDVSDIGHQRIVHAEVDPLTEGEQPHFIRSANFLSFGQTFFDPAITRAEAPAGVGVQIQALHYLQRVVTRVGLAILTLVCVFIVELVANYVSFDVLTSPEGAHPRSLQHSCLAAALLGLVSASKSVFSV